MYKKTDSQIHDAYVHRETRVCFVLKQDINRVGHKHTVGTTCPFYSWILFFSHHFQNKRHLYNWHYQHFQLEVDMPDDKTCELTIVRQVLPAISIEKIKKDKPGPREAHDFDSCAHVQHRHDNTTASYVQVMHTSRLGERERERKRKGGKKIAREGRESR